MNQTRCHRTLILLAVAVTLFTPPPGRSQTAVPAGLRPAEPGDRHGDVWVDTERGYAVYKKWLAKTRSAVEHSPDGTRRPFWMLRPVRPERAAYRLPEPAGTGAGS